MQWLREEHDKELNAAKDNGTTETIEEPDKLCQILEDKKGDIMKFSEELDTLMEKLRALQHSFNKERVKVEKYSETIQVPQKYLKWTKAERTTADNSTWLHPESFKVNINI